MWENSRSWQEFQDILHWAVLSFQGSFSKYVLDRTLTGQSPVLDRTVSSYVTTSKTTLPVAHGGETGTQMCVSGTGRLTY